MLRLLVFAILMFSARAGYVLLDGTKTCLELGYTPVMTEAECTSALAELGLTIEIWQPGAYSDYPAGCGYAADPKWAAVNTQRDSMTLHQYKNAYDMLFPVCRDTPIIDGNYILLEDSSKTCVEAGHEVIEDLQTCKDVFDLLNIGYSVGYLGSGGPYGCSFGPFSYPNYMGHELYFDPDSDYDGVPGDRRPICKEVTCLESEKDCEGVCNGNAVVDCEGVCAGNAELDCAGACNGPKVVDSGGGCCLESEQDCGDTCHGAKITGTEGCCLQEEMDCAGICGGNTVCVKHYIKLDGTKTCLTAGHTPIMTESECRTAVNTLGLDGQHFRTLDSSGPPSGCSHSGTAQYQIFFNTQTTTETNSGSLKHYPVCLATENCDDDERDCAGVCHGYGTSDCAGVCNGNSVVDCTGVCGGTGVLDCSGVCGGNAVTGSGGGCCLESEKDCAGTCNGNAVLHSANNCCLESELDCAGTCNGGLVEDCAGVCNGDSTVDCAGVCGGGLVEDCAGVCGGNVEVDCEGVCGGNVEVDCQGVCGGDAETDCLGLVCKYLPIEPVQYTLVMIDSYGDGWNGGRLVVGIDGTDNEFQLDDGRTKTEMFTGQIEHIFMVYGSYAGEVSFDLEVCGQTKTYAPNPNANDGEKVDILLSELPSDDCAAPLEINPNSTITDCLGVCNGTAVADCAGICNGNTSEYDVRCLPECTTSGPSYIKLDTKDTCAAAGYSDLDQAGCQAAQDILNPVPYDNPGVYAEALNFMPSGCYAETGLIFMFNPNTEFGGDWSTYDSLFAVCLDNGPTLVSTPCAYDNCTEYFIALDTAVACETVFHTLLEDAEKCETYAEENGKTYNELNTPDSPRGCFLSLSSSSSSVSFNSHPDATATYGDGARAICIENPNAEAEAAAVPYLILEYQALCEEAGYVTILDRDECEDALNYIDPTATLPANENAWYMPTGCFKTKSNAGNFYSYNEHQEGDPATAGYGYNAICKKTPSRRRLNTPAPTPATLDLSCLATCPAGNYFKDNTCCPQGYELQKGTCVPPPPLFVYFKLTSPESCASAGYLPILESEECKTARDSLYRDTIEHIEDSRSSLPEGCSYNGGNSFFNTNPSARGSYGNIQNWETGEDESDIWFAICKADVANTLTYKFLESNKLCADAGYAPIPDIIGCRAAHEALFIGNEVTSYDEVTVPSGCFAQRDSSSSFFNTNTGSDATSHQWYNYAVCIDPGGDDVPNSYIRLDGTQTCAEALYTPIRESLECKHAVKVITDVADSQYIILDSKQTCAQAGYSPITDNNECNEAKKIFSPSNEYLPQVQDYSWLPANCIVDGPGGERESYTFNTNTQYSGNFADCCNEESDQHAICIAVRDHDETSDPILPTGCSSSENGIHSRLNNDINLLSEDNGANVKYLPICIDSAYYMPYVWLDGTQSCVDAGFMPISNSDDCQNAMDTLRLPTVDPLDIVTSTSLGTRVVSGCSFKDQSHGNKFYKFNPFSNQLTSDEYGYVIVCIDPARMDPDDCIVGCDGVCDSGKLYDCTGTCGGPAMLDTNGVCCGPSTMGCDIVCDSGKINGCDSVCDSGLENGCDGVCNSGKVIGCDDVCDSGMMYTSGLVGYVRCCHMSDIDCVGICNSETYPNPNPNSVGSGGVCCLDSVKDCAGTCNGDAIVHSANNCCLESELDCAGECNGPHINPDGFGCCLESETDCAGNCHSDLNPNPNPSSIDSASICCLDSDKDCSGMCNGTLQNDCAGECNGLSINPDGFGCCLNSETDCAGNCHSDLHPNPNPSSVDSVSVCCLDSVKDCVGHCNGPNVLDNNGLCCHESNRDCAGICGGNATVVQDSYVQLQTTKTCSEAGYITVGALSDCITAVEELGLRNDWISDGMPSCHMYGPEKPYGCSYDEFACHFSDDTIINTLTINGDDQRGADSINIKVNGTTSKYAVKSVYPDDAILINGEYYFLDGHGRIYLITDEQKKLVYQHTRNEVVTNQNVDDGPITFTGHIEEMTIQFAEAFNTISYDLTTSCGQATYRSWGDGNYFGHGDTWNIPQDKIPVCPHGHQNKKLSFGGLGQAICKINEKACCHTAVDCQGVCGGSAVVGCDGICNSGMSLDRNGFCCMSYDENFDQKVVENGYPTKDICESCGSDNDCQGSLLCFNSSDSSAISDGCFGDYDYHTDISPVVYTLVMKDSHGDGWNGAKLFIRYDTIYHGQSTYSFLTDEYPIVNGNGHITLSSGYERTVTFTGTITRVDMELGSKPLETSWELYDCQGNTITWDQDSLSSSVRPYYWDPSSSQQYDSLGVSVRTNDYAGFDPSIFSADCRSQADKRFCYDPADQTPQIRQDCSGVCRSISDNSRGVPYEMDDQGTCCKKTDRDCVGKCSGNFSIDCIIGVCLLEPDSVQDENGDCCSSTERLCDNSCNSGAALITNYVDKHLTGDATYCCPTDQQYVDNTRMWTDGVPGSENMLGLIEYTLWLIGTTTAYDDYYIDKPDYWGWAGDELYIKMKGSPIKKIEFSSMNTEKTITFKGGPIEEIYMMVGKKNDNNEWTLRSDDCADEPFEYIGWDWKDLVSIAPTCVPESSNPNIVGNCRRIDFQLSGTRPPDGDPYKIPCTSEVYGVCCALERIDCAGNCVRHEDLHLLDESEWAWKRSVDHHCCLAKNLDCANICNGTTYQDCFGTCYPPHLHPDLDISLLPTEKPDPNGNTVCCERADIDCFGVCGGDGEVDCFGECKHTTGWTENDFESSFGQRDCNGVCYRRLYSRFVDKQRDEIYHGDLDVPDTCDESCYSTKTSGTYSGCCKDEDKDCAGKCPDTETYKYVGKGHCQSGTAISDPFNHMGRIYTSIAECSSVCKENAAGGFSYIENSCICEPQNCSRTVSDKKRICVH